MMYRSLVTSLVLRGTSTVTAGLGLHVGKVGGAVSSAGLYKFTCGASAAAATSGVLAASRTARASSTVANTTRQGARQHGSSSAATLVLGIVSAGGAVVMLDPLRQDWKFPSRLEDLLSLPTVYAKAASPPESVEVVESISKSSNLGKKQASAPKVENLKAPISSLEGFILDEVIGDDSTRKVVFLLGRFKGKDGKAVVKLEKSHITADILDAVMKSPGSLGLECVFKNDIYGQYVSKAGQTPPSLASVTAEIVYPATQKDINKYKTQSRVIVRETPEEYRMVTKQHIQSIPPARLQWVQNILAGKAEQERLIGSDKHVTKGFVLLPDMKWDAKNDKEYKQLYCLAIARDPTVHSLRDLSREHLPMLKNIKERGLEFIEKQYGVDRDHLRIFVHYQPSYYHFHVHFVHVDSFYGVNNSSVGRAHLLDDIIENIENFDSRYYQKKTISMVMTETDPIYKRILKLRSNQAPK